jgi:DNA-binding NtrC family response regulator
MDLSGLDILVLEDDALLCKRTAALLERLGAEVSVAPTLHAARALLSAMDFDLALLDVNLPDGVATDLLRNKELGSDTVAVVVTAHGGVTGAVEAIRLGAADYLVKPFEAEELPLVLERARRSRQSARVQQHRRSVDEDDGFHFGNALQPLRLQLDKIINADNRMTGPLPPVLVLGETGTGKSALARWLHKHGPRAPRDMVEVNCSAFPETLAESELFGHERGAFTDARTARMGLFEAASGATLFLDELPSLSLALQAKVLTAIEDRRIRRVGGNKLVPVDCRIIAATQRDLKELVAAGEFREDLYHRLDLYRVTIPPLRERGEDIIQLAEWFLKRLCRKHSLPLRRLSNAGRLRLLSHDWPGNVRELAHEIERALIFEDGEELNFAQLPGSAGENLTDPAPSEQSAWLCPGYQFPDHGFVLEEAINRFIQLALNQADGNVSAAARLLGVPRDFVRYRLGLKNRKPNGK